MKPILLAVALSGVATGAMAADLPSHKQAPAPVLAPYVPPPFSWTGFYLGLNAGVEYTNFGSALSSGAGFAGGGTVGYNQQIGQVVVGLEGDWDWTDAGAKGAIGGDATKARESSFAMARARLGYAMDRTLLFGTLGYSGAEIKANDLGLGVGQSSWRNGIGFGGGAEFAVTNNVSVKGEYVYSMYDSKTLFGGTADQISEKANSSRFLAGVNYKF